MNFKSVLLFSSVLALSVSAFSQSQPVVKTLDAQALTCGGLASLTSEGSQVFLNIKKVSTSTCSVMEIMDLNQKGNLSPEGTKIDVTKLGPKVALIIDNQAVVLSKVVAAATSASAPAISAEQQRQMDRQAQQLAQIKANQEAQMKRQQMEDTMAIAGAVGDTLSEGEK